MRLEDILNKKKILDTKIKDLFDNEEIEDLFKKTHDTWERGEYYFEAFKESKLKILISKMSHNITHLRADIRETAERLSTPEKAYNGVFDVLDSLKSKIERWLD